MIIDFYPLIKKKQFLTNHNVYKKNKFNYKVAIGNHESSNHVKFENLDLGELNGKIALNYQ